MTTTTETKKTKATQEPKETTETKPTKKTKAAKEPKETTETKPTQETKETSQAALTAIIIDDEPANLDFLVRLIEKANYEVKGASTGEEAVKMAESLPEPPSLIITDSKLPDKQGVELIKIFREKYPTTKIIMATMLDDRPLIHKAFENGCDVFLVKPNGFMELYARLQKLRDEPDCLSNLLIDHHGVRDFKG